MRQTEFFLKACDPKTLTVGQLMQDAVTRCSSRTDASTIAHMMTSEHRVFDVEEDGTLVRIVTGYDLLQAMLEGVIFGRFLLRRSCRSIRDRDGGPALAQVADLFKIVI